MRLPNKHKLFIFVLTYVIFFKFFGVICGYYHRGSIFLTWWFSVINGTTVESVYIFNIEVAAGIFIFLLIFNLTGVITSNHSVWINGCCVAGYSFCFGIGSGIINLFFFSKGGSLLVSYLCVGSGGGVDVLFIRVGLCLCEVLSSLVRVFSIWFRMFCNIVGGHVVCDGMLYSSWFGASVLVLFYGSSISVISIFIFNILVLIVWITDVGVIIIQVSIFLYIILLTFNEQLNYA